jgi:hypothetical protein
VVMMAVAVEDSSGGQQLKWRTMIVAEDNGMQDQAVNNNGEGQERVAREVGDSRVAMMAAAAKDGGGRQRWWRWATTGTADDDSSRRQRRRMMTAHKIKRRTMRGKEESRRQTTMALGQPGREHETKIHAATNTLACTAYLIFL